MVAATLTGLVPVGRVAVHGVDIVSGPTVCAELGAATWVGPDAVVALGTVTGEAVSPNILDARQRGVVAVRWIERACGTVPSRAEGVSSENDPATPPMGGGGDWRHPAPTNGKKGGRGNGAGAVE